MNITIIVGWWLLPLLVTVTSFVWAFWPREDERPTGQMFDGMGRAFGELIRGLAALSISLFVWLLWALIA